MRIEELRAPSARQTRMTVVFDDGTGMKLLPAVAAEQGLFVGQELDEQELQGLRDAAGKASAKSRAVRMISVSALTKDNLQSRLLRKGEKPEDAEQAVQWLSELKLLDDAQVAQQVVSRGVSRGYGKARIRQMLYEKRVPKQYWDEALSQVPEMDDTLDRFLQDRFRGTQPDRQELKRAIDALSRRGHCWADIRAALRRYSDELEEITED